MMAGAAVNGRLDGVLLECTLSFGRSTPRYAWSRVLIISYPLRA